MEGGRALSFTSGHFTVGLLSQPARNDGISNYLTRCAFDEVQHGDMDGRHNSSNHSSSYFI